MDHIIPPKLDQFRTAASTVEDGDRVVKCQSPGKICWSDSFRKASVLVPIYFDEVEHKNLYGYLELTRNSDVDWLTLFLFLSTILLTSGVQALRQYWNMNEIVDELTTQFSKWTRKLRSSPSEMIPDEDSAPYEELNELQNAVNGLQVSLRKLEEEAKSSAQIDLLREIGHDLRTPLTQLSQSIAIHLDTVDGEGKSDPDEVARIKRALRRMGDLIRQVRSLAPKAKNQGTDQEKESGNLSKVTTDFVADLEKSAEMSEKNIKIVSRLTPSLIGGLPEIDFYRILDNLVRNAIDASPVGGSLVISLSNECGFALLRISDEGEGIPQSIQGKIFNFNFTTKSTRGTGLGLAIVRNICEAHGGTVGFSSRIGAGTTFEVRLPLGTDFVLNGTHMGVAANGIQHPVN